MKIAAMSFNYVMSTRETIKHILRERHGELLILCSQ